MPTVFEHHGAMGLESLKAFVHEYAIKFPVGVDRPSMSGPIPQTMARYQMRGTPTLLLIDGNGLLRLHAFGRPSDMAIGAAVAELVSELGTQLTPSVHSESRPETEDDTGSACAGGSCAIPAES